MQRSLGRSPTFLVGSETQRHNLEKLQKREEHLEEQYLKNKPLSFIGNAYQKTHPSKAATGHRDADVTLVSPMLLGVADGVSQIEDFGIDSSLLPRELLNACQELAMMSLLPDKDGNIDGGYAGPIPLMREAFESTESLGSTTVCLAVLDNSTRIHGKLHPMIAVLSIGDCELIILRPQGGKRYEIVFNTEMQRIDGNAQCPLQVCRLDDRVDPDFEEDMTIEVIERGSAVHCVSVYEGDIIVMGSDGVFDNLFKLEVAEIVNSLLQNVSDKFSPIDRETLGQVARRVVEESHNKTKVNPATRAYPSSPIGKGGKQDDTSCVVGQVIEWTEDLCKQWSKVRYHKQVKDLVPCGAGFGKVAFCRGDEDAEEEAKKLLQSESSEEEDERICSLM